MATFLVEARDEQTARKGFHIVSCVEGEDAIQGAIDKKEGLGPRFREIRNWEFPPELDALFSGNEIPKGVSDVRQLIMLALRLGMNVGEDLASRAQDPAPRIGIVPKKTP